VRFEHDSSVSEQLDGFLDFRPVLPIIENLGIDGVV
jgi:hypothetical protein